MNQAIEKKNLKNLTIIPLDDIVVEFEHQKKIDQVETEAIPVLTDTVGDLGNVSPLNQVEETIRTLENSIDSLAPKVPVVPEGKLAKIKENAKMKLKKRTIREELKDVHYDANPEIANLENTIILNSEILKQDLEYSRQDEVVVKNSNRGKYFVIGLFILLVIFAVMVPFIAGML